MIFNSSDTRPNFKFAYGAACTYYNWLRPVVGEADFRQEISMVLCEFPDGEKSGDLARAVGRAMYRLATTNGYRKPAGGKNWEAFVTSMTDNEIKTEGEIHD